MKKTLSLLIALIMCISMAGTALAAGITFTDVKTTDWFYNDVKTAVEMGLVNGKSATSYAPNDKLTYAEAIKLAACMNQLYEYGEVTLSGGNPWYKPYVDYCIDEEIIDKEYNYTENVTRAGYMGIFAKALPDDGLKEINNVPDDAIPDVPSSRAYAEGVYKLYRAGILQGVDEAHNCNPLANITRAEVAAILTRMMNEDARVKFNMGSTGGGSSTSKNEDLKVKNLTGDELEIPDLTTGKVQVKATGGEAPYTYKWEFNFDGRWLEVTAGGGNQYTFTGEINTDTLDILASVDDSSADMRIRCTVTDANGDSVTSDETHTIAVATELKIENLTGDELKIPDLTTGKVQVKATGGKAPYTYKWEFNFDGRWLEVTAGGGNQYTFTGEINTDTLDILASVDDSSADMKIRCTVTDANGESVTSDETHTIAVKKSVGGIKDKFEPGTSEELKKEDFLMYVEEVYTITGRGVVVTGRVSFGKVNVGDSIQIVSEDGSTMEATVAGIEMFKKMLDEAEKGDNIGLLFGSEIEKGDVARGDSLIGENSPYGVYEKMTGTLSLTSTADGGRTSAISEGFEASFYRSGHDFTASITGLNDGTMNPGETQDNVTVTTKIFRGVFYVGQVLEVRQAGRKIGSFTIDSFSSVGRVSSPNGKTQYMED